MKPGDSSHGRTVKTFATSVMFRRVVFLYAHSGVLEEPLVVDFGFFLLSSFDEGRLIGVLCQEHVK